MGPWENRRALDSRKQQTQGHNTFNSEGYKTDVKTNKVHPLILVYSESCLILIGLSVSNDHSITIKYYS